MRRLIHLIPCVAGLLAASMLTAPALATDLTLKVPGNLSQQCLDLFDNGCAVVDSGAGINAQFTFPAADLTPGQDWCFTPTATDNTILLDFGGGSSIIAKATRLCLTLDSVLGVIPDQSGGFTGSVDIISGTGLYSNASGSGTFAGGYSSSSGSVAFLDIEFNFGSFTLALACDPAIQDCSSPGTPPPPGATPELDSIVLFGSALLTFGGYMAVRRRARRPAA